MTRHVYPIGATPSLLIRFFRLFYVGALIGGMTCGAHAASLPPAPPMALPPQATLTRLGINGTVLAALLKKGAASHTDAIVVMKDDEVVGQWYYNKPMTPIEAMSVTKSVVTLAIGCLIHDGKIKSLDQPVADFYPEWRQGRKAKITLRQILNHTSGLQANPTTEEIYASPDFVQLALCAELQSAPGTVFFYNNKAVNLLAGIVQKASGQRLDTYVAARIFTPLGITDYHWDTDPAGTPQVFAGLQIRALDLAKIGQMLADGGTWQGRRVVDAAWIDRMTMPGQSLSPSCGLLWWLLHRWAKGTIDAKLLQSWRQGGVPERYTNRAQALQGKLFPKPTLFAKLQTLFGGPQVMAAQLQDRGLSPMRTVAGPQVGYFADGYLGQYLVIIPKEHLVAVRQISSDSFKSDDTDNFEDFTMMVPMLVGETVAGG